MHIKLPTSDPATSPSPCLSRLLVMCATSIAIARRCTPPTSFTPYTAYSHAASKTR
ncbi:hypothetical protein EJ06DRAFT_529736 [Trichodelitschia bisporula]|uniref:Uncharacterized protein n=1 Tax=Trichodelitschia bisporula TaxID=703511 RepID=A0A6G1HX64_9PEZI|nr:hypothetical protein EJ06DRAFT_529736 [Trichodelitschia bisporula]